jgi:hypothetical protein
MATRSESRRFYCHHCEIRVDGVYERCNAWQNADEIAENPSLPNLLFLYLCFPFSFPWLILVAALQGKLHCPACRNPQL